MQFMCSLSIQFYIHAWVWSLFKAPIEFFSPVFPHTFGRHWASMVKYQLYLFPSAIQIVATDCKRQNKHDIPDDRYWLLVPWQNAHQLLFPQPMTRPCLCLISQPRLLLPRIWQSLLEKGSLGLSLWAGSLPWKPMGRSLVSIQLPLQPCPTLTFVLYFAYFTAVLALCVEFLIQHLGSFPHLLWSVLLLPRWGRSSLGVHASSYTWTSAFSFCAKYVLFIQDRHFLFYRMDH